MVCRLLLVKASVPEAPPCAAWLPKPSLSPPRHPHPGLADAAAALLAIADDNGLGHLRAVALDWIVHHYDAVARTGALGLLKRTEVIH